MKHIAYKYSDFSLLACIYCLVFIIILLFPSDSIAQTDTLYNEPGDTINIPVIRNDTINLHLGDTLNANDSTISPTDKKKSAINSKVDYSATDSISLDLENQKVFMYKDADIKYELIKQKAAYIVIDFNTSILTALPLKDSIGKEYGLPEFSEGDQSFKSKEMRYNFRTRKGFIRSVVTKEEDGYLHGEVVKKMDNDVSNMRGGGFTTCSLEEHPHFALRFTKAKVIPNNKIVTGPAYMTIEDVPIPIVLPFGLFPNKRGQTSGVIIPTYGESRDRGFYLENGGYYFGINDYMELKLLGDIYSRGSWALEPVFNYRKRYKFSGGLNFGYTVNTSGVQETQNFSKTKDFRLVWNHRQDPKARPKSQFNANVNLGSRTYNRYNPVSAQDLVTNTFISSVSYSTTFGERVSFSAAFEHKQNTTNKTVDLTLPRISMSVNRFYPLRRPGKTSNLAWYDNISMSYNVDASNEINTYDSLLFTKKALESLVNGVKHTIPIDLNLKVLKYFSLNSRVSLVERWYSSTIEERWVNDTLFAKDTIVGYIAADTIPGFKAAHEYNFGTGLTTSLYGMLQFKKGPVRALRHVMRPSVGFSYTPEFGAPKYGYYSTVQTDTAGNYRRYSIFGGDAFYRALYGAPVMNESGSITFSISNNLEMKVRSRSDTVTGMKKVVLIESFNIGTSYNMAADSLKWSSLRLQAATTLFKKLRIQYSANYNPYIINSNGRMINKFEWDVNKRLFRKENSRWNLSLSYNISSEKGKSKTPTKTVVVPSEEAEEIVNRPEEYINWNNPWSFNFNYSLNYDVAYSNATRRYEPKLIQTLGFNGDVNITPKWKVNYTSGYDFIQNKLSYTSVSIYRDLHCWEMRFNWIPLGVQKSWNFYIKVKAGVLQDLKLNRKKDFRDN